MHVKDELYKVLINRVPGIKIRYQNKRDKCSGNDKVIAWAYLLWLNGQYYILRNMSLREEVTWSADRGKEVVIGSESQKYKKESPQSCAEGLKKYDVISFDVFDTLILRKMFCPEDVFFLIQSRLKYPNFKQIRKEAETAARIRRYEEFGDYEVRLEEIWEILSEKTGIDLEEGMSMEKKKKKELCCGNPYFLAVVKKLKEYGKKIIVCSDMYLSERVIKCLLKQSGYPEFDRYYISAEYRQSKSTGLYETIRQDLGKTLSCIHIGDNKYTDFTMAKRNHFHTVFYANTQESALQYRAQDMDPLIFSIYCGIINGYLHCGFYQKSPEFEFGFIYGGLFVTGFCQFIKDYVTAHSTDKILFLARDGEILEKAYRFLYPEDAAKCEYVYWSRLASTKMSARIFKAHFTERMLIHKIGQDYRLEEIFDTMGILDLLDDFIEEYAEKRYLRDSVFDAVSFEDVKEYTDRHWTEICHHYDGELAEGRKYFSPILGNCRKAVAVDVGWVGSGIITLRRIAKEIWGYPCEIRGILAGTCGGTGRDYEATLPELDDGSISSFLFSPGHNRDIWKKHDPGKGHNMLIELLLSSKQRSFRGFVPDEDGNYSFNNEKENINADEIQKGIMKFVKMYKNHPLGHLRVRGRDAAAPIMLLYDNPKYMEKIISVSGIQPNIV